MQRIVSTLFGLAVFAAIVVATRMSNDGVQTVHAQSGCSLATLKGTYGFIDSGFSALNAHGTAQFPVAAVGIITFDGAGNAPGSLTASFNGKSSSGTPFTGTYTVNSDCSGFLTSPDTDSFAFVIVSGGADVLATDVSPGTTASLELKKE